MIEIGDFVIVRFGSAQFDGGRFVGYHERLCLVTGVKAPLDADALYAILFLEDGAMLSDNVPASRVKPARFGWSQLDYENATHGDLARLSGFAEQSPRSSPWV